MASNDRVGRDRGLRRAVLAGDEQAWRTWYEESFGRLEAYVSWRSGGLRDLCDDVVQETWLVAVRRLRHFDPEQASFLTWLRGIAANLLRNHLRREVQRNGYRPQPKSVASGLSPAMELEQREQAERIARALAALPEHYEAVLRAKYVDQQSVAEIAESLHESPKAIESLLTRARQAFRAGYGQPE
jgi:RNA polymerase sigma-70 factor (ECF subfamily)